MQEHLLIFHIIWATNGQRPWLEGEVDEVVYRAILTASKELEGEILAIGSMPDHIHIVASTSPDISLDDYINGLKEASFRAVKAKFDTPFRWHDTYGVISLGGGESVQNAISYVQRQAEHHEKGTLIDDLEQFEVVYYEWAGSEDVEAPSSNGSSKRNGSDSDLPELGEL